MVLDLMGSSPQDHMSVSLPGDFRCSDLGPDWPTSQSPGSRWGAKGWQSSAKTVMHPSCALPICTSIAAWVTCARAEGLLTPLPLKLLPVGGGQHKARDGPAAPPRPAAR